MFARFGTGYLRADAVTENYCREMGGQIRIKLLRRIKKKKKN